MEKRTIRGQWMKIRDSKKAVEEKWDCDMAVEEKWTVRGHCKIKWTVRGNGKRDSKMLMKEKGDSKGTVYKRKVGMQWMKKGNRRAMEERDRKMAV